MSGKYRLALACLLLGAAAPSPPPREAAADAGKQWAQTCKDWDDWDKAGPPFQVWGNTYYVGTCGISAILITGDEGDILIDGGPANAASLVAANIEALGFKLSDVKLLLHSHEHHDHVGALAELQRLTGAKLLASRLAAPVLASGTASSDDPQAGMHERFPAAHVSGIVTELEPERLGSLSLVPMATPGHTPGALSWHWRSCDGENCREIAYADSLSPVSSDSYKFSDHPAYLAAFRASLKRVAAMPCDILLTPHPSASAMRERLLMSDLSAGPTCGDYARGIETRLDQRLAEEAKAP
jgi:metallo-beta-lactamase class B